MIRVQPLLLPILDTQEKFIPESIPSFSLREMFEILRKNQKYNNIIYKDATLNPVNLRDQADEFEANIVQRFRQESELKDLSGFRTIYGESLFYTARPFRVQKQTCLRCHSTPEAAPKSQIATYGREHGFGWKLNEIIATQIVYVPAKEILANAQRSFLSYVSNFRNYFYIYRYSHKYFVEKSSITADKENR